MTRPPIDQSLWQPWIDHVCTAVGVDPALVDVGAIHVLSGEVAEVYERPMAPVAAHLWGLARGVRPEASPDTLGAGIIEAAVQSGRAAAS